MAESNNRLSCNVHIEAIQTVTPAKMTQPDRFRRISTSDPIPITEDLLRTHHRLVAYCKNSSSDYSAFSFVGFLKESLNVVLGDHPLFAGRLRKNDKSGEVDRIKFNDAGIRLVQAKAEMSMEEFIDNTKDAGGEGLLAYWMDICFKTPHFSPLFYVQVTSFQGNEYSISLSCSVLLADPVMMTEFMRVWAQVHTTILLHRKKSLCNDIVPIFHLAKFKRPGVTSHITSKQLNSSPTSLFNHESGVDQLNTITEEGAKFYRIDWGKEETRVESVSAMGKKVTEGESVNWDVLTTAAAKEAFFGDGHTTVHVSYHLESNAGAAGVIIFPSKMQNELRWIAAAVPIKI